MFQLCVQSPSALHCDEIYLRRLSTIQMSCVSVFQNELSSEAFAKFLSILLENSLLFFCSLNSQAECMVGQLADCSEEQLQNMMNITHEDLASQLSLVCGSGGGEGTCDFQSISQCADSTTPCRYFPQSLLGSV